MTKFNIPKVMNLDMKKCLMNYLLHELYLIDPYLMARMDLIDKKNEMYIKMFKGCNHLTDDGLLEYKREAVKDILRISDRIMKDVDKMSNEEGMTLMSSSNECSKFLEQFKTPKEVLENDKFLRRD